MSNSPINVVDPDGGEEEPTDDKGSQEPVNVGQGVSGKEGLTALTTDEARDLMFGAIEVSQALLNSSAGEDYRNSTADEDAMMWRMKFEESVVNLRVVMRERNGMLEAQQARNVSKVQLYSYLDNIEASDGNTITGNGGDSEDKIRRQKDRNLRKGTWERYTKFQEGEDFELSDATYVTSSITPKKKVRIRRKTEITFEPLQYVKSRPGLRKDLSNVKESDYSRDRVGFTIERIRPFKENVEIFDGSFRVDGKGGKPVPITLEPGRYLIYIWEGGTEHQGIRAKFSIQSIQYTTGFTYNRWFFGIFRKNKAIYGKTRRIIKKIDEVKYPVRKYKKYPGNEKQTRGRDKRWFNNLPQTLWRGK